MDIGATMAATITLAITGTAFSPGLSIGILFSVWDSGLVSLFPYSTIGVFLLMDILGMEGMRRSYTPPLKTISPGILTLPVTAFPTFLKMQCVVGLIWRTDYVYFLWPEDHGSLLPASFPHRKHSLNFQPSLAMFLLAVMFMSFVCHIWKSDTFFS